VVVIVVVPVPGGKTETVDALEEVEGTGTVLELDTVAAEELPGTVEEGTVGDGVTQR